MSTFRRFCNVFYQYFLDYQYIILSKNPFKWQDIPIDLSVADHGRVIDVVSDSTLQLTLKRLSPVEIRHSTKEKISQLYKKAVKIPPFS